MIVPALAGEPTVANTRVGTLGAGSSFCATPKSASG